MGLGAVRGIVHPPAALLHSQSAPFRIGKETVSGDVLRLFLGEDYVAVLVLIVRVLVALFFKWLENGEF